MRAKALPDLQKLLNHPIDLSQLTYSYCYPTADNAIKLINYMLEGCEFRQGEGKPFFMSQGPLSKKIIVSVTKQPDLEDLCAPLYHGELMELTLDSLEEFYRLGHELVSLNYAGYHDLKMNVEYVFS